MLNLVIFLFAGDPACDGRRDSVNSHDSRRNSDAGSSHSSRRNSDAGSSHSSHSEAGRSPLLSGVPGTSISFCEKIVVRFLFSKSSQKIYLQLFEAVFSR